MTEPAGDTLAERIRHYREEVGLSLSQLAAESGVSKGYLWSLENKTEDRKRPSGETLFAVAEALGVTIAALMGRELVADADDRRDLPPGLEEFAKEEDLPEADVRMLSSIRFRGEPPRTRERWQYIYNAIRTSRGLDDE